MSDLQSALPGSRAAAEAHRTAPPASATNSLVSLFGLAGFAIGMVLLYWLPLTRVEVILVILACTGLPMLIVDIVFLKAYRRPSTGLDWDRPADYSLQRSAIKILGLAATLAILALGYWLFPEYRGTQYAIVFEFFAFTWPYLTAATLIYIVVIDAHMKEPHDGYWLAGALLLGRFAQFDRGVFAQYCAGWLMKAFFVPFIISVFMTNIDSTFTSDLLAGRIGFGAVYDFCYPLSFAVDTAFSTLGYLLTIRLADAHLRSTDLTVSGWLVALICYPPFWPFIYDHFLPYDAHAVFWGPWFEPFPLVLWLWGSVIMVSLAVFSWATIMFGLRFSNLTHRGIITSGPYRWCKHPAYVSKIVSYWMIALPFIPATGTADAVRGCLMLTLLSFVYFLRALTEERHLSRDPAYVAYALWMNEHGLLRWLGNVAPFFRYRPPSASQLASSSVSQ